METTKRSYGFDANGDAMRTQVAVVRDYMASTRTSITQKFATDKWGLTRLSAIIFDLKEDLDKEGNKQVVKDRRLEVINRFGNKTHCKEYWIEDIVATEN